MIIDDFSIVLYAVGVASDIIILKLVEHFQFLRKFYKENHKKEEVKK